MTEHRLVAEPRADLDVTATFDWYENEEAGLGREFLDELRATYDRIVDGPLAYQDLRSGIRRAFAAALPVRSSARSASCPWRGHVDLSCGSMRRS